jgi:hypothetical protein
MRGFLPILSPKIYSRTPLPWTLVTRTANYQYRFGRWGIFVENFTKLTYLESTNYRIKYSIRL